MNFYQAEWEWGIIHKKIFTQNNSDDKSIKKIMLMAAGKKRCLTNHDKHSGPYDITITQTPTFDA